MQPVIRHSFPRNKIYECGELRTLDNIQCAVYCMCLSGNEVLREKSTNKSMKLVFISSFCLHWEIDSFYITNLGSFQIVDINVGLTFSFLVQIVHHETSIMFVLGLVTTKFGQWNLIQKQLGDHLFLSTNILLLVLIYQFVLIENCVISIFGIKLGTLVYTFYSIHNFFFFFLC